MVQRCRSRARDSRDMTVPIGTPRARDLPVREVFYGSQEQYRALLFRQLPECAQKIAVLERGIRAAIAHRQLPLADLRKAHVHTPPPPETLIGRE